ncbi:hypothetical protein BaRGS_00029362 [Batillaria attramentaria]|uniref:Uncharacterized protein n=1 Tax=Batillaria attramentaria TaxID=370345 RepID=A0ABD0JXH8_9CAEN
MITLFPQTSVCVHTPQRETVSQALDFSVAHVYMQSLPKPAGTDPCADAECTFVLKLSRKQQTESTSLANDTLCNRYTDDSVWPMN